MPGHAPSSTLDGRDRRPHAPHRAEHRHATGACPSCRPSLGSTRSTLTRTPSGSAARGAAPPAGAGRRADWLRAVAGLCALGRAGHAGRDGAAPDGLRGRRGLGPVQASLERDGVQVLWDTARCGPSAWVRCSVQGGRRGRRSRRSSSTRFSSPWPAGARHRFGLEELACPHPRGTVEVNAQLQSTKFPNPLCGGDVAGPYQFTHTAAHMAWYATVNAPLWPLQAFLRWTTAWCPGHLHRPRGRASGCPSLKPPSKKDRRRGHPLRAARADRAITESATQGFVRPCSPPRAATDPRRHHRWRARGAS